MMNIDHKLDALKKILQVEAPLFLLTRIKQHIQSLEENIPVEWKWTLAALVILIISLNLSIVFNQDLRLETPGIETVANSMNLNNNPVLYHE